MIPISLCFISFAALFVKVKDNISHGFAKYSDIIYPILVVKTLVLPVPSPDNTNSGPSVVFTASNCSGFSPSKKLLISLFLDFFYFIHHNSKNKEMKGEKMLVLIETLLYVVNTLVKIYMLIILLRVVIDFLVNYDILSLNNQKLKNATKTLYILTEPVFS